MKFNRCLLLSLLLFVVLLPAFINAEQECEYDGGCYGNGDHFGYMLKSGKSKKCADACYAFQCLDKDNRVMKGEGCYDDFVNACKWISSDVKLSAKGKKDLQDSGENYVVVSCTGITGCASLKLNQYLLTNGKQFGTLHGKMESKTCEYDDTPKPKPPATLKCEFGGYCTNSYQFLSDLTAYTKSPPPNLEKQQCDGEACTFFMCLDGAGQKYMIGGGCLNDFERICTAVPADAKKKIRENKNDYFYDDGNTFMVTCSTGDECVDNAFKEYNRNHVKVAANFDESYNETCTFPSLPRTTASSNGPNDFEFSGMLLFGLSLFQLLFW